MKFFQVDAFTKKIFGGNPAAVVPLEFWLDEELMQRIAEENNLSETAFFVKEGDEYHIRWFTPVFEVDLCGHATLASAYVIHRHIDPRLNPIRFKSRSGELIVHVNQDTFIMDFPRDPIIKVAAPFGLEEALGVHSNDVWKGRDDYMVIIDSEEELASLTPDYGALSKIPSRGILVSAPSTDYDFVSRCFFPTCAINEDPVTGSAHTSLTPYWANRLGKTKMSACQISSRRGEVGCELIGNRVLLKGNAVQYAEGEMKL